ncbi:MAG: hypothetical protein OS130_10830 [Thermodesulfobacteriota bacterium]|nr:MAG: hypothetical protein OS130_10830 [Thermodesulfobacteriota bacterium]
MGKRPLTILGINPGTRYLGIAFFHGPELKDWRIKVVEGRRFKDKLKKTKTILSDFFTRYEPNVLAIKKLHPSRSSLNLSRMVSRLKEFSKRQGLRVYEYSVKDLEKSLSSEKRIKNKRELQEVVAALYPFLVNELNKEKKNKNPYFVRMFEAIALGIVCFNRLDH